MKRRDCEQCWAEGHQWVPATFRAPDGRDLCQPCVLAEGFQLSACEPIAPLVMATAAAAGPAIAKRGANYSKNISRVPVITVHAAKPTEFVASKEGAALINAAVKTIQEEKRMPPKTEAPALPKRICALAECGKEFQPKQKNSMHCSTKCYGKDWYRRNRSVAAKAAKPNGKKVAGGGRSEAEEAAYRWPSPLQGRQQSPPGGNWRGHANVQRGAVGAHVHHAAA